MLDENARGLRGLMTLFEARPTHMPADALQKMSACSGTMTSAEGI